MSYSETRCAPPLVNVYLITNLFFKVKISLYYSVCAETEYRVSIIGDKLQLQLYISPRFVSVFFFAVTRGEREMGVSFEFRSLRILGDSRL